MQKISGCSSASMKCVACGKKTGNYRTWGYKEGIEISVPVCHKCEKDRFGWCLDTSMDIHLKGIRESIRHSIIITHNEKQLLEQTKELRQMKGGAE